MSLASLPDEEVTLRTAGNRTLQDEEVPLGVDADDFQVARGDRARTHVAGHPMALPDTARRRALPDRTGLAVRLRSVCPRPAAEPVALHAALESASPRDPAHVDDV